MDERVSDLVAFALDIPVGDVRPDTSPQTAAAWDSMRNVLMLSLLEQEFGVSFTSDERDRMVDAAAIEAVLREKDAL